MNRVKISIAVCFGVLICVMALWATHLRIHSQAIARFNACLSNLDHIRAAKEQWAMDVGATNNVEVNIEEVSRFIKGGLPICPVFGSDAYVIGRLLEYPCCKTHGYGAYDEKDRYFQLPPEWLRMDGRQLLLVSPQAPVAK